MARGGDYGAGVQDTTLARHEQHLEEINGSVEKTAEELKTMNGEVRSLREEGQARETAARRRWVAAGVLNGFAILVLSIVSILRGSPF